MMENYRTIDDAYTANDKIRSRLTALLSTMDDQRASASIDGSPWSIRQIVEHIAIVNEGTARIVAKLLVEAIRDGKPGDGVLHLSPEFGQKGEQMAGVKVEAPERVQPTGDVSISVSLERITAATEAMNRLKADLQSYDLRGPKFPHPFFGNITAAEWLVLGGLHELRHTKQIERLIQ